jgi:predicted ATPase
MLIKKCEKHITIMLIELVNQCAHPIVPQLDDSIVKTSKDPGPFWVETQPFHTGRLRLEFGQHHRKAMITIYESVKLTLKMLTLIFRRLVSQLLL